METPTTGNTVSSTISTSVSVDVTTTTSIPSTSIPNMPPLSSAPAQLPPVVHPPPIVLPSSAGNGSAEASNIKVETTAPIQAPFETLSLNTPLQPIAPVSELSHGIDLTQSSTSVSVPRSSEPTVGDIGPSISIGGNDATESVNNDVDKTG
jgi:hypothetical protein